MQARLRGSWLRTFQAGMIMPIMFLLVTMNFVTFKLQAQQEEFLVEYYSIPSPDEILNYIHENEIIFTPRILISTAKANTYNTLTERLLAYGFYTANMAYAISFDQTGTAVEYFELTDNMGRQLNLFPPGTEQLIRRLKQNVNNVDSLNFIYDEIYLTVVSNLHDTERFGEYALISAGGFIESLFLALNSNEAKLNNEKFKMRVWDQRSILDQITRMIERHVNPAVKPVILQEMKGLSDAFNEFPQSNTKATGQRLPSGAIAIGTSQSANTMVPPITRIHNEVNKLRNLWVN